MPRRVLKRCPGIHRALFGTWFGMALDDQTIEAIVAGWSHKLADREHRYTVPRRFPRRTRGKATANRSH